MPKSNLNNTSILSSLNITNFNIIITIKNGAFGGIRTHDLYLRKIALYPAELQMLNIINRFYLIVFHTFRSFKFQRFIDFFSY